MRNVSLLFAGLCALHCASCAAAPDAAPSAGESVAEEGEALLPGGHPTLPYFIVTHPVQGGYSLKRLNQAKTLCLDGFSRAECRVASLDMSNLGLSADDAAMFDLYFSEGYGVARGVMNQVETDAGLVDTLTLTEAWIAETGADPAGAFYMVTSTGVACLTTPCPSYDELKLNGGASQKIAGLDLLTCGADHGQADEGAREAATGLLVAGAHGTVTGPAGSMKKLVATEFYVRLRPQDGR